MAQINRTEEEKAKLCNKIQELYDKGVPLSEMGSQLCLENGIIYYYASKMGLHIKSRKNIIDEDEERIIKEMYCKGQSEQEIADFVGRNKYSIMRKLAQIGLRETKQRHSYAELERMKEDPTMIVDEFNLRKIERKPIEREMVVNGKKYKDDTEFFGVYGYEGRVQDGTYSNN